MIFRAHSLTFIQGLYKAKQPPIWELSYQIKGNCGRKYSNNRSTIGATFAKQPLLAVSDSTYIIKVSHLWLNRIKLPF